MSVVEVKTALVHSAHAVLKSLGSAQVVEEMMAVADAKAQVEPRGNYPPHSKAARALVAQAMVPFRSLCLFLAFRHLRLILRTLRESAKLCRAVATRMGATERKVGAKGVPIDTGCFGKEGKCSEGIREGCECDEDRRFIPTGTQTMIPIRPTNPVSPPPVCPSRPDQCGACGGDSVQEGVCNGPDLLHLPATKAAPIGLFPTLDPAQHVIAMGCGVPPHPKDVEVPPLSVKMSDCDKMRKDFTTGDVSGTIDSQSDCVGPTKQTAGADGKVISTACAIRVEGSCALVIGSQNSINGGHTRVVRNHLGNFISDATHRKVGRHQKPPAVSQGLSFPILRPTPPMSGRFSPFTAPQSKSGASGISRSNASTPVNDSFANLVAFNVANGNKTLSLQEQHKRLQEERTRQQQAKTASPFAQQDEDFWAKLGSGTTTPDPVTFPSDHAGHAVSKTINRPWDGIHKNMRRPSQPVVSDSDLLSDFVTPSDDPKIGRQQITLKDNTAGPSHRVPSNTTLAEDDDDPFGLGSMAKTTQTLDPAPNNAPPADDDLLGLLGRPVSEFPSREQPMAPAVEKAPRPSVLPTDQALAELVDMGFAVEKSRQALATTTSGIDVQAAVGWLLNEAHQQSQSRSRAGAGGSDRPQARQAQPSPPRQQNTSGEDGQPAWMRDSSQSRAHQERKSSRSPVNGERDPSKVAAELGNNLFKTANSIWKTGTKKVIEVVAEFNSDSDSSQPRWMREPTLDQRKPSTKSQTHQEKAVNGHEALTRSQRPRAAPASDVTDEALMLESADARPPPRKATRPKPETDPNASLGKVSHRQPSPSSSQTYQQEPSQPTFMQSPGVRGSRDARGRLSKQAVEEQTAEAYISPARRKKSAPKPPAPEPDLLFGALETPTTAAFPSRTSKASPELPFPRTAKVPLPKRPQAPKRNIPPISLSALVSSHTSRQAGTLAFKRGDYAEAATHYSSALAPLPPTHPLSIPLLTNRALSHLKTGDPKNCIADSNTALDLIGPARGVGETVDLGDEGTKDMFTYWDKAMTRQAEALEQLERWGDAGAIWKSCVEAGVGGATSIAGRNRCEKVIKAPSQLPTTSNPTVARKPPAPKPKPRIKPTSALEDLSGTTSSTSIVGADSAEAVARLRAANLEAERLDDERFALSDKVSERVTRWRSGKEGNLRALLASLDSVLWEGSGWTKVGMGELILANKVKVVYMKGIGKVHPDKLPTTATTEQKMVSAAVFATLNEAWDGFKRENGL
ncbi:MAG: hypothetical protein Q9182_006029 [Xanthomendoza sp. 2 TL-2023]